MGACGQEVESLDARFPSWTSSKVLYADEGQYVRD